MLNYTTLEELKQIPIEEIKKELYNPSETVLEIQEYLCKNRGIVMHPEYKEKLCQIVDEQYR